METMAYARSAFTVRYHALSARARAACRASPDRDDHTQAILGELWQRYASRIDSVDSLDDAIAELDAAATRLRRRRRRGSLPTFGQPALEEPVNDIGDDTLAEIASPIDCQLLTGLADGLSDSELSRQTGIAREHIAAATLAAMSRVSGILHARLLYVSICEALSEVLNDED